MGNDTDGAAIVAEAGVGLAAPVMMDNQQQRARLLLLLVASLLVAYLLYHNPFGL